MNTYNLKKCPICNNEFVSTDRYCPKCGVNIKEPFKVIHYPTGSDSTDSYSIEWDTCSKDM